MEPVGERTRVVEEWARVVLSIWHDKIETLGIGETRELINSFTMHIQAHANGDTAKIEFAFNFYGKFVDMGVGKGVTITDAGMPYTSRRPKPWYSKTFLAEVKKLASIMAAKFAEQGAITILENINDRSGGSKNLSFPN